MSEIWCSVPAMLGHIKEVGITPTIPVVVVLSDIHCITAAEKDGWMTCDFTSFSTVFHS